MSGPNFRRLLGIGICGLVTITGCSTYGTPSSFTTGVVSSGPAPAAMPRSMDIRAQFDMAAVLDELVGGPSLSPRVARARFGDPAPVALAADRGCPGICVVQASAAEPMAVAQASTPLVVRRPGYLPEP